MTPKFKPGDLIQFKNEFLAIITKIEKLSPNFTTYYYYRTVLIDGHNRHYVQKDMNQIGRYTHAEYDSKCLISLVD